MDEDSIIRLCNTAFQSDEIVTAKKLLFESVQTNSRIINRKGDGKEKRDMEDILCIIKETDPENLPVFVARDLQRLPPVTFDHLDATRLLKDIIQLQNDIDIIKENYVTKDMLRVPSPEVKDFVNKRCRGAGLLASFDCESGPIGLPHISSADTFEKTDLTNNPHVPENTNTSVSLRPTPMQNNAISLAHAIAQPHARALSETSLAEKRTERTEAGTTTSSGTTKQSDNHSYAEVAAATVVGGPYRNLERNGVTHKILSAANTNESRSNGSMQNNKNEWTLVRRKRNKNKFIGKKGIADVTTECKFKAASTKIPFYIYNVSKECQPADIIEYIKCKTDIEVKLEQINMKLKKDYEAYKFLIPKETLSIFMNENLWPSGISFRKYVTFNKKWNNGENYQSSATNND